MKLSQLLLISALVTLILVAGMASRSNISHKICQAIYGNNDFAGKYYSINGIQLYCETYGSGEPLLMLHGNGGNITAFSNQIPYFSKHYKVIVVDSRGQGKSIDNSDSLTYEQMTDDFAALLSALAIDSAHVLGWSDGGINGLLLAMRHPEKVKKLVITGANLQPDSAAVDPEVIKEFMPTYLELKSAATEKKLKDHIDSTRFKLFRLLMEQPNIVHADLHKITCPTLVIGGDRDMIRPAHTMEIFQNIPNASLWILPNCGHATLIDYADEFNEKVMNFFKQPQ